MGTNILGSIAISSSVQSAPALARSRFQSWMRYERSVPQTVYSITIEVWGAEGGTNYLNERYSPCVRGGRGGYATGVRSVTNWPAIVNLRADPYEEMMFEGEMATCAGT